MRVERLAAARGRGRGRRARCRRRRAPGATATSPPPCSSAFAYSSQKISATAVAVSPGTSTGSSSAAAGSAPRPWPSMAARRRTRSDRSTSPARLAVSRSCTSAIDSTRSTESSSARAGSPLAGAQAQQRRDGLQVVLDAVVDLLGDQLAHHAAARLDGRRRLVRDRAEQRLLLGREARRPCGGRPARRCVRVFQTSGTASAPCSSVGARAGELDQARRRRGRPSPSRCATCSPSGATSTSAQVSACTAPRAVATISASVSAS